MPSVPIPQVQEAEITVGTPQWDELTARRAALIDKMFSPGQELTEEEKAEFERLQRLSREAIDRAFPRPRLAPEELLPMSKRSLESTMTRILHESSRSPSPILPCPTFAVMVRGYVDYQNFKPFLRDDFTFRFPIFTLTADSPP